MVRRLLLKESDRPHAGSILPEVCCLVALINHCYSCSFLPLQLQGMGMFFCIFRSRLCASQAEAATAITGFLKGLYHESVFVPSQTAEGLAQKGLTFLRLYAQLAQMAFSRRQQRFPMVPKAHYLHHQVLDLLSQARQGPWATNLLVFACQSQEDYVGKPSRLARRTNPRLCSHRVIQRVFLSVRNTLQTQFSDEKHKYVS